MRIYRFEAKMADLMNVSTIGGRMGPPSATSATDAALGLRPRRALSSAQLSAEWTTSNPLRNDSSLNSFYPLNFVSHNMGAVHTQAPLIRRARIDSREYRSCRTNQKSPMAANQPATNAWQDSFGTR